jgi:hypothetical protein
VNIFFADDLRERLLAHIATDFPGGEDVPLGEHFLDLLQRASRSLGEHEDDVDSRKHVEGAEDEVGHETLGGHH